MSTIYGWFATAYHRGGLRECLQTEREIDLTTFMRLLGTNKYKFYCYDERIHADRFLLIDMEKDWNMPTWLHAYRCYKSSLIDNDIFAKADFHNKHV